MFNTPELNAALEASEKHELLVCEACGKGVTQDGDNLVRSCGCPEDTEVRARLRATIKVVTTVEPVG